jgi:hypothetical protein
MAPISLLFRLVCSSCLVVFSGAERFGGESDRLDNSDDTMVCETLKSLIQQHSSTQEQAAPLPGEKGDTIPWLPEAKIAFAGLIKALAGAPLSSGWGSLKGSSLQRAMYVGGHAHKLRAAGVAPFLTVDKGMFGSTFKLCFSKDLATPVPTDMYRDAQEIDLISDQPELYSFPWPHPLEHGVVGQGLNQGHAIEAVWPSDSVYQDAVDKANAALKKDIAYDMGHHMDQAGMVEAVKAAERAAMPVDLLVFLEAKGALEVYAAMVQDLKAGIGAASGEESVHIAPAQANSVAESFKERFRGFGIALYFCEYVGSLKSFSMSGKDKTKLRHYWFEYVDAAILPEYLNYFPYRAA